MSKVIIFVGCFTLAFLLGMPASGDSFMLAVPVAHADKDKDDGEDRGKGEERGDKDSKDGDHKVTICHNGTNTLSIDESALPAHQAHGDTPGACSSCSCPPGVPSCICPDGTPGAPGPGVPASPETQRTIQGG